VVEMVDVLTAFATLAASGVEKPLHVGGGEEQAGVPPAAVEPAPSPEPAPPEPVGTESVRPTDRVPVEPAPEPVPGDPTDPVR
jgi:hypothetical protein